MGRKYLLFNSPLTWIGLLAGMGALFLFMKFFAYALRDYDFAVGFILAIIAVVTVNLCYAIERRHQKRMTLNVQQEESR
ncbi:MAG: hypothetical protein P8171_15555 [Candidatus Thiodiazotropha sp.]|jgi:hypothetical protein